MTINDIIRTLKEKELYFDDVVEHNNEIIVIISWGDWKHEHLYCDYLMREMGYELEDAVVTEEDGSDCYSADRYYKKIS